MSVIGMLNSAAMATAPAAAMAPPWGAIASIGGNLLSGLFGNSGKTSFKNMRSQMDLQKQYQMDAWEQELPARMRAAKSAGIHPLAALGMQGTPVQTNITPTPSKDTSWMANMGQDVSRAVGAYMSPDDRRLATAQGALQTEGLALDNEYKRAQIRALSAAGTGAGISGGVLSGSGHPTLNPRLGFDNTTYPLHTVAIDEKGRPIPVYNTNDLGDNEAVQLAHFLRYTAPDYIHQRIGKPTAQVLRGIFGTNKFRR